LCGPPKLQITEKALIHDLPKYDKTQTRSQTRNRNIHQETLLDKLQEYADKIEEMEDRNDPPDKESDIEDNKSIDSKEDLNIRNDENHMPQMKPTITNVQTFKNNIIDSCDLLFLRKDNIACFVDINEKPLDSGSQKLFETRFQA